MVHANSLLCVYLLVYDSGLVPGTSGSAKGLLVWLAEDPFVVFLARADHGGWVEVGGVEFGLWWSWDGCDIWDKVRVGWLSGSGCDGRDIWNRSFGWLAWDGWGY